MDIIGVYIGVYIAVRIMVAIILIATTATITVIATAATITITAGITITIIAIGKTYRIVALSNSSLGKSRSVRCGLFPFPTPARCQRVILRPHAVCDPPIMRLKTMTAIPARTALAGGEARTSERTPPAAPRISRSCPGF